MPRSTFRVAWATSSFFVELGGSLYPLYVRVVIFAAEVWSLDMDVMVGVYDALSRCWLQMYCCIAGCRGVKVVGVPRGLESLVANNKQRKHHQVPQEV